MTGEQFGKPPGLYSSGVHCRRPQRRPHARRRPLHHADPLSAALLPPPYRDGPGGTARGLAGEAASSRARIAVTAIATAKAARTAARPTASHPTIDANRARMVMRTAGHGR